MKNKIFTILAGTLLVYSLWGCSSGEITKEEEIKETVAEELEAELPVKLPAKLPAAVKIKDAAVDTAGKEVHVTLSDNFSHIPMRAENVNDFYEAIREILGAEYSDYKITAETMGYPIEELIPNYYRDTKDIDEGRMAKQRPRPEPVVRNIDKPFIPVDGLYGKNILLWHSHGWYYSNNSDRWEWQRPRLFQSVEDMIPMQFVIPYLIPMLENAGANVFVPRERDYQVHEVVVDYDKSTAGEYKESGSWQRGNGDGFSYGTPPYGIGDNPFKSGSFRYIQSSSAETAAADYIPEIPETGEYGVYVSYSTLPESVSDALYTVYHAGGSTSFNVNQQTGGGTWIYLGKFKFNKGYNAEAGKVTLSNKSGRTGVITADAVRFGGGMGLVERNGAVSGRPKFLEGARYWLQYAGMPDTLVYSLNKDKNDYNDDYQSRAEYGNYLMGAPAGPNRNRSEKGLGIPIDLSMAFHTDAGITTNDTTIGTLAIYSLTGTDTQKVFPDGVSRIANRDLSDIIQTQIVEDIRVKFDNAWSRRQLREALYSESMRPNIPSVLLELLSHQNFLDMKFVLDPKFRFTVSRSIYKGMLKFLASYYKAAYTVQPLPVDHFSAELQNNKVLLKWAPVLDPLESSAVPDGYIVYTREENGGFDNGKFVDADSALIDIEPGKIYSFKISAVNKGGESLPGEILSVYNSGKNTPKALIVNGFDRVSAPSSVNTGEFAGFTNFIDAGVPDKIDLGYTGMQYDYNPESEFITNDAPGWGASSAEYETSIIAGNSFDYPYLHGSSFTAHNVSFSSCSDEALEKGITKAEGYNMIDLILGEQRLTKYQKSSMDSASGYQYKIYSGGLRNVLTGYLNSGGNLLISGAYSGTDLLSDPADSLRVKFASEVLKYKPGSSHASKTGIVFPAEQSFGTADDKLQFNTILNDSIYAVEAPDAVAPAEGGEVLFRYDDNKFPAVVGYQGNYRTVIMGFPFETILHQEQRDRLLSLVLNYFKIK